MSRMAPSPELDTPRPKVRLDGRWEFSYDPGRTGVADGWYAPDVRLPERIAVPGCSQARRFRSARAEGSGFDGLPELKSGTMLRYGCMDDSWYKKAFHVPASWRGKEVWLHAGGVKPAGEFWLNGHRLGATATSRSPVRCNLTQHVRFGDRNVMAVRVHWPKVRLYGCHDGICAWSGLYRSIWIEAVALTHVADLHAVTSIDPPSAAIHVALRGKSAGRKALRVVCDITGPADGRAFSAEQTVARGDALLTIDMPDGRLWSPDTPALYTATVRLFDGERLLDTAAIRFGLREIRTEASKVLLNGKPIFLRGGCDDQLYPETVCPPADKEFFVERLGHARRYGFNYTKSCVEVFTKEFLDAADEVGYLVCQEMPFGLQGQSRERRYNPPAWLARFCKRQLENIVVSDRNHPSVVVYSMASELSEGWLRNPASFQLFSRDLPPLARALNPGTLVFDATGVSTGPRLGVQAVPVDTPAGERDTDLQGSWLVWSWDACPLTGPIPGLDGVTLPFVLHEHCWITQLSDPAVIKRMQGLPVKPLHVPEMCRAARANGQAAILDRMVECSRKLKYALLKDCLEIAREDPRIAGYHQWLIHDFPFCQEGVLNEFWEEPEDVPADEFRTHNGDTVLLLKDHDQRCFEYGGRAPLALMISHFGADEIGDARLEWRLSNGARTVARGVERFGAVGCGELAASGDLGITMPPGRTPAKLEMSCELTSGGEPVSSNHWNLWVFPPAGRAKAPAGIATTMPLLSRAYPGAKLLGSVAAIPPGTRVLVSDTLADPVVDFLAGGGHVVLLSPRELRKSPGEPTYRSVPYNSGTTGNMGTLIRPHPALGRFPHEGWCDFCFAPLIQGAHAVALDAFRPQRIEPIIRSIGHMRTMSDKAYMFELGVGQGRLLVCSLRLAEMYDGSPAARYLVDSMLRHMSGRTGAAEAGIPARRLREIRISPRS